MNRTIALDALRDAYDTHAVPDDGGTGAGAFRPQDREWWLECVEDLRIGPKQADLFTLAAMERDTARGQSNADTAPQWAAWKALRGAVALAKARCEQTESDEE